MHIILILLFLLGGLLIYFFSKKEKIEREISIWGGLVLFFYGALRSTSVGIDVPIYVNTYLSLPYMSFKNIFTSNSIVSRDPFFYAFMKLLTYISEEPQFMLIIISAIVAISISIYIYKNSVNPILSFVMFIGLRYYAFTLSGLRQAIAWSIVMLSYAFLKQKKMSKFILTVCIASLFHRSALFFILAYPIANIKRIDKMTFIIFIIMLFNFITDHAMIKLIVKLPILQQYEGYIYRAETTTSGFTMLIIYLCILVFAFISRERMFEIVDDVYVMYNLSLVGIAITALTFSYANMFRIGYYYILSIILLFPCAIKSFFDKKMRVLINYIVIILLVIQFSIIGPGAGTENYHFFWK